MKRFAASFSAAIALLALVATACGDPSGPSRDVAPSQSVSLAPNDGANLLNTGLKLFKPVKWYSYCGNGLSASAKIGSKGGEVELSKCDVTVSIPAGVLKNNTLITITSMSGAYVSYDIQPHGLTFSEPVIVTQKLKYTGATRDPLVALTLLGVYVAGDLIFNPDGTFLPTELLSSKTYWKLDGLRLVPEKQVWQLKHFSRYMLASG
jgi:hypothetical protein